MYLLQQFLKELNFVAACRRYGISLWQCPQFLFIVMGAVIIVAMITTFYIGTRFAQEPSMVALIVMAITIVLFIVGHAIITGFEKVAEASRLKSELVSIVSHQLRSPISNLKWTIEFLLSGRAGELQEKQRAYLEDLKTNNERMINTVRNMLKTSQLEQGVISFVFQAFSIADMLKRIIRSSQAYAQSQNVVLVQEIPEHLPLVWADPQKVEFVLENFIDNAIRYIRTNGHVRIRVMQRKNYILTEVIDDGIGIPVQEQRFVFQKFFRAQGALRYQTEGTGLGLYVAKSFLEKMKGRAGFRSQENKGSTFWFTLPIAKPM